jgi:hypothetical protein
MAIRKNTLIDFLGDQLLPKFFAPIDSGYEQSRRLVTEYKIGRNIEPHL